MGLADRSISPRQNQVLGYLREWFNGDMEANAANYKRIARAIGWKQHGGVIDCLFALRAKGAVEAHGISQVRPERWKVIDG